ncbi:hypothetical protein ACLK17_12430 [Escherichia coli]
MKGVQFRNHEIIGDIVPLAKPTLKKVQTNWCLRYHRFQRWPCGR